MYRQSYLSILLFISLSCLTFKAYAATRIPVFSGGNTVTIPQWSGSGGISYNFSFCIVSTQGAPVSTDIQPYALRANNRNATDYNFTSTSDPSQSIPSRIDFIDLQNSGNTQTLSHSTFSTQNKTGASRLCPDGNNAQLTFILDEGDLSSVLEGNYELQLRLTARGGNSGTQTASRNLNLTLSIPGLVRISNLNDIILPAYSGTGNLNGQEDLCIFSNTSGGNYQVTLAGSGTSSSFSLSNGPAELPYSTEWDDQSTVSTAIPNTPLLSRQNGFPQSLNCYGGINNNASINLELLETDIKNAGAGNFGGTLTITIAPE